MNNIKADRLKGGLSKLAQAASKNKDSVSGTIIFVSPDDCIEVTNPRKKFNQELIDAYATEFVDPEKGQLEPIHLYPADSDGKYRVHQGATRTRAGKVAARMKPDFKLKAYIDHSLLNKSELTRYIEQGKNNIMRDNMSLLDRANYFADLIELGKKEGIKVTQADIAEMFGWKNTAIVSRTIKLCKMSEEVKAIYESGKTDDLDSLTMLINIQEKNNELFNQLAQLPELDRAVIRRANSTGSIELPREEPKSESNEGVNIAHAQENNHNKNEPADFGLDEIPFDDFDFKTGQVTLLIQSVDGGYQGVVRTEFPHGINESGSFDNAPVVETKENAVSAANEQLKAWAELICSDKDSVSQDEYKEICNYLEWVKEFDGSEKLSESKPTPRKAKAAQLRAVIFVKVNDEDGVLLLKVPKENLGTDSEGVSTNGFVYVQIGSEIRVVKDGEYTITGVSYRE